MTIICPKCGNAIESPDNLVDGQHVQCPYCGEKFEYHARNEPRSETIPKTKSMGKGKLMIYGLRILAGICCFLAVQQFLSGWLNLPDFNSMWLENDSYKVGEESMRVAVVSIGKMFAGYFFAKVSRRFWRMTK